MKTIGLIGGMSWESTVTYYQILNEVIMHELGGLHSAKIVLYSVDFDEIEKCQTTGNWQKSAEILIEANQSLEKAGADFSLICTNTMHKVFPEVQSASNIPLIHIAEATAEELQQKQIKRVLLLGTKYTMEQDFYKEKIIASGIDVVIPDETERKIINEIIFAELCVGKILPESKKKYVSIIEKYASDGVSGVILGCTEIGLLIQQADVSLPIFDTAEIHARKAAYYALGK